ncbi:MAG: mannose-phosphate guanylyltransferase [Thermoproteota archaeon]|nr:mannose-phosphate guanylyltransferase [Thermoproteota archaeon]
MKRKYLVKGVILSGGEGRRLRPLSFYLQKGMIPVGPQQNPLLEYIVRAMGSHGVDDIAILAGYKHEQIANYFGDGDRFGVRISYVLDEEGAGGTGTSLLNAYSRGAFDGFDVLFIHYGDILTDVDLADLLGHHLRSGAMATLMVSRRYRVPVGVAEVGGEEIVRLVEKPELDINVTTGILVLSVEALKRLDMWRQSGSKKFQGGFDIMANFIPRLIEEGAKVVPYVSDADWYDVGSIEKYEKLDNGLIERVMTRINSNSPPLIAEARHRSITRIVGR